jgi:hypothetical protein
MDNLRVSSVRVHLPTWPLSQRADRDEIQKAIHSSACKHHKSGVCKSTYDFGLGRAQLKLVATKMMLSPKSRIAP